MGRRGERGGENTHQHHYMGPEPHQGPELDSLGPSTPPPFQPKALLGRDPGSHQTQGP